MINRIFLQLSSAVASIALISTAVTAQQGSNPQLPVEPVATDPAPPAQQPPAQQAKPPVRKPAAAKPAVKPKPKIAQKKAPVDSLRPGQFVWEARAKYSDQLRIVVVIDIQRMYVFDGDELVAFSTISTGKKGHVTPTGAFKILQKNVDHKSNLYSNAPMPYMQRLTWDGIALHAGHIPGYPASHGCVRMPLTFAKMLYGVTKMDQSVIVLSDLSQPRPKPAPEPVKEPVKDPLPEPVAPATPEAVPNPTPQDEVPPASPQ